MNYEQACSWLIAQSSQPISFADKIAQRLHILYRSFGENAVAEIENVAGASGGLTENFFSLLFYMFPFREEEHGIEIALHPASVP